MKKSHLAAFLLLGMLTAACSGDKNAGSADGAAEQKPSAASVSQPAEKAAETSESKPAEGAAAAQDEQDSRKTDAADAGNKAEGNSMDADSYKIYAEGEKESLKDLKESLDGLIEMAEDEKISEERVKQFRQCADDYYKSVGENSPEHYRQHIQALDKLIESMQKLEAKGILGIAVNTCIGAFNINKVQYMVYAGEADDKDLEEAKNKMEQMAKQAEEETERMKAEFLEKAKLNP
ncbi:hypothetical protein IJT93_08005 [bacterium]|nr:hypothetical protein [bacterium]